MDSTENYQQSFDSFDFGTGPKSFDTSSAGSGDCHSVVNNTFLEFKDPNDISPKFARSHTMPEMAFEIQRAPERSLGHCFEDSDSIHIEDLEFEAQTRDKFEELTVNGYFTKVTEEMPPTSKLPQTTIHASGMSLQSQESLPYIPTPHSEVHREMDKIVEANKESLISASQRHYGYFQFASSQPGSPSNISPMHQFLQVAQRGNTITSPLSGPTHVNFSDILVSAPGPNSVYSPCMSPLSCASALMGNMAMVLNANGDVPVNNPYASMVVSQERGPIEPGFKKAYPETRGAQDCIPPSPDTYSTVMLKNIPNKLSQWQIVRILESRGYRGKFTFFYSPLDFKSKCNLGYAFVNLVDHNVARHFMNAVSGTKLDPNEMSPFKSNKLSGVAWARIQGHSANVKHYRNSPVNELSDEFRPLIFEAGSGLRMTFPPPDRPVQTFITKGGGISGPGRERKLTTRDCKVFVGGLSLDTTSASLHKYMSGFGSVEEAAVICGRSTGVSKGFGFCSFSNSSSVQKMLEQPSHWLDGHAVVVRPYTSHR